MDAYVKEKRNFTKDLWKFVDRIQEGYIDRYGKSKSYAPMTKQVLVSNIKIFLERQDIEIKHREYDDIKGVLEIKRVRSITEKKTPTNEDLKKILNNATNIKSKVLFMFSATTGMRINEVLQLTFDDIRKTNNCVHIRAEMTKNKVPRRTFYTEETAELLEQWLDARDEYLLKKYKKSKYVRDKLEKMGYTLEKKLTGENKQHSEWVVNKDGKKVFHTDIIKSEDRIFPFDYQTALNMWHTLLERTGSKYSERDKGRYVYNIHSLRRFWFTTMENSGVNINHINFMGAHDSELNGMYTHFDTDILQKTYQEVENRLGIFTKMFEVETQLKPQIKNLDNENKTLRKKVQELKERLEKYEYTPPTIDPKQIEMLVTKSILKLTSEKKAKLLESFENK